MLHEPQQPPFQLHLPGFEGTLPALMDLVSEHRLAVDDLPLVQVTEQFSSYLQNVEEMDLRAAGEFLSSAARLMLLKSEVLLPGFTEPVKEAEDGSGSELSFDLAALQGAAQTLSQREGAESVPPAARPEQIARPVEPRCPSVLKRVWEEICSRTAEDLVRVAAPSFVRIEAALSRLIRDLKSGVKLSLHQVLRGSSRNDAVIHFIAVLELVRRRQASAAQDRLFGEITLERTEEELDSRVRAG